MTLPKKYPALDEFLKNNELLHVIRHEYSEAGNNLGNKLWDGEIHEWISYTIQVLRERFCWKQKK